MMKKKTTLTIIILVFLTTLLFVGVRYFFSSSGFAAKVQAQTTTVPADSDWFTLGGSYQRTSWVNSTAENQTEIRGNLNVEWYQPIEPYIPYKVQPILTNDTAYISTSKGLYAFDLNSTSTQTKVKWVYPTELPLGHSPTVVTVNEKLTAYVGGYDKKIHAIDANTGQPISGYTPYEAEAGFETNPLVINNTIYAGNRDGKFYALNAVTGEKIWEFKTDGPILFSAAYNPSASSGQGALYFASNDSYAYAVNATNGEQIWKSEKLPGAGFHSYWPVIYTEKETQKDYVVFGGGDNFRIPDMRGEILSSNQYVNHVGEHSVEAQYFFPTCYNDTSNNGPTCPRGEIVGPIATASASETFWTPGTTIIDVNKAVTYFETYPHRRTSFVLDASNGREYTFDSDGDGKIEYAPFTLTNVTGSGNRYPAIVGIDGILYSTNTYASQPHIPRGDLVGWRFGTPFISRVTGSHAIDEPLSFSSGGKLVYWSLMGERNTGAFDITIPYGQPGRSYTYYDSGGSNITSKAPDFDPMYYDGNPDHYADGNASWRVYSGKNQSKNGVYGKHGVTQSPPIPYKGKVYILGGNTLMVWKPGTTAPVKLPLASIVSANSAGTMPTSGQLQQRLETEIQKILAVAPLRPGYHSAGIYDNYFQFGYNVTDGTGEILDYFQNPADTVYTLTLAYPYLSASTQQQVKTYLQDNYGPGSTYDFTKIVHVGWSGASREAFDIPPEDFAAFGIMFESPLNPSTQPIRTGYTYWKNFPPFSFYAAWKYAQIVGNNDQALALSIFNSMSSKLETPPSDAYFGDRPYILNLYIAGYQGYLELQKSAGLAPDAAIQNTYNHLLSIRVGNFNKDIPLAWQTGGGWTSAFNYNTPLAVARNFMFMTPELGDYLNQNILTKAQEAVNEYQYIAPYWFVPKFDNTTGEGTLDHLYNYPSLFQAKAWILKEPYPELVKYLDVPGFERGDLFYIQNLTAALEVSQAGSTDINGDTQVDLFDLQLLFENWNTPRDRRADINGDDLVNGVDFGLVLRDWGKTN